MEKVLNNQVRMINDMTQFCDGNTGATSGINKFAPVLLEVKNGMTIVNGLDVIASGKSKGVRLDVLGLRDAMSTLADKCAKGTLAFANDDNNNALKVIVNWTKAKLDKLQNEAVDDVCEGIFNAANDNIADVVDWGVDAGDPALLSTAIGVYRLATGKTRIKQVEINNAKKQMKAVVKSLIAEKLKGKMDLMVGTLKTSNTVFHDKFFKMREQIDLGSTTAKVRGTGIDFETEVGIDKMKFTMFKAGAAAVYKTTLANSKGIFGISDVDADDYDFEWSKEGYTTKREEGVHIAAGKEIKRRVVLKKIL